MVGKYCTPLTLCVFLCAPGMSVPSPGASGMVKGRACPVDEAYLPASYSCPWTAVSELTWGTFDSRFALWPVVAATVSPSLKVGSWAQLKICPRNCKFLPSSQSTAGRWVSLDFVLECFLLREQLVVVFIFKFQPTLQF